MTVPLLSARGLTVKFGGLTALNRLDFTLNQGELVGLIGPNGSGKTTFFNTVTGLYKPAGGQVLLEGRDVTGLAPQRIYAAGITRTFQRSRLCLPLTVFDNLMIGNHRNLDHRIVPNLVARAKLRRQVEENIAGARRQLARFSPGLAQRLFEPVAALTMIDRRRVEICRALLSRPRILLLDEPSAGMTHDETHTLMDDLLAARRELQDLSVVLIEHEMKVIERVSDRCTVLNYGEKICEGAYHEVAADEQVRKAYLGED